MAKKIKRKAFKKIFNFLPGEAPGSYQTNALGDKPVIELHKYNAEIHEVKTIESLSELKSELSHRDFYFWVDVRGLGDVKLFDFMRDEFGIHSLVLEDVTKTHERPKLEEYDDFIYLVSRMLYFDAQHELINEQLNFIQMERILFTFQHLSTDCLEPIRRRLRTPNGPIRDHHVSMLTYAIIDVVIDHYFAILGHWNNELDDLEDRVYKSLDKSIMGQVQLMRRMIISMKRAAWAERDLINDMMRSNSKLIHSDVQNYLKDVYDHTIQAMEMIESLKEIATSVLEMYLSMVSNRMNEIMKFLTIMSSLFIPLTFIAGIYGMNFAHEDAKSGKILNWNMPELYAPHGYLYTLVIMGLIVLVQIVYFWRKGWFK